MATVEILAFDPKGASLRSHPLPLSGPGSICSVRLRSLPGASGVHVVLTNGEGVLLRAEIAAESDERVEVDVEWQVGSGWRLASAGRRVLYLPSEDAHEPVPPFKPLYKTRQLDVALVVDGTLRSVVETPPLLLADRERWGRHAAELAGLVERLAGAMHADARTAVIAFGDRPLPWNGAFDLRPAYHLHPPTAEARLLRREEPGQLLSRLAELPATSGGDLVDGLADALAACQDLRWRNAARKILVLTGDSPGYSILQPAPRGADAQTRERDVDVEAKELHGRGIEILVIHHGPGPETARLESLRGFLEHTRTQYLRLASRPELFFEAAGFEVDAALRALASKVPAVGRGASPGIFLGPFPVRKGQG
jgi:hypothetical protein